MRLTIFRIALIVATYAALWEMRPRPVYAVELCAPSADIHNALSNPGDKWITLTPLQRAFMAGVYAVLPSTPSGLPYGETAVLAISAGNKDGAIFFVDGDRACTPIPASENLVKMLTDLESGVVNHEGSGM